MTTVQGMSDFKELFLPPFNGPIIMLIVSVFLQVNGSLIFPH